MSRLLCALLLVHICACGDPELHPAGTYELEWECSINCTDEAPPVPAQWLSVRSSDVNLGYDVEAFWYGDIVFLEDGCSVAIGQNYRRGEVFEPVPVLVRICVPEDGRIDGELWEHGYIAPGMIAGRQWLFVGTLVAD